SLLAPLAGGIIAQAFGLNAPFLVAGVMALLTAAFAFAFVPESGQRGAGSQSHKMRWTLVGGLMRSHWRDLSAAGIAQIFAQMIRSGRQLLIPLFGQSLGLDVQAVGSIVSFAAALDVAMFFPAGFMMD
ncbi:hypothetical protein QT600_22615, partial [Xanthomonas citri pv. citri]